MELLEKYLDHPDRDQIIAREMGWHHLRDDDVDEIGMTIAYLKRALKAISNAMDAALQLKSEVPIRSERFGVLTQRLFQIRDGIITLMGDYRAEWRRRFED